MKTVIRHLKKLKANLLESKYLEIYQEYDQHCCCHVHKEEVQNHGSCLLCMSLVSSESWEENCEMLQDEFYQDYSNCNSDCDTRLHKWFTYVVDPDPDWRTETWLAMLQLCTIVVFVSRRILTELYEEVSTFDETEGTRMLRYEINKKPAAMAAIRRIYWMVILIHLVFQVMCWFSQIIYPG